MSGPSSSDQKYNYPEVGSASEDNTPEKEVRFKIPESKVELATSGTSSAEKGGGSGAVESVSASPTGDKHHKALSIKEKEALKKKEKQEAEAGKKDPEKYPWLTFKDNSLEDRYTYFAYVHSGFYGGKLWHGVAFLIVLMSFFYYHTIRHHFTMTMFYKNYWIAMTITAVATVAMGVCLFVERLYPYREVFFLISLFTHWPAFLIALMYGLGKPFVYAVPILSGCFFFCSFVVQARFSRIIWFLTFSPLFVLIVSTNTFPYNFWTWHSTAEIIYWGYLVFPVVKLYYYEINSRKYYVSMEQCEDQINKIEAKIEATRKLIANFFPCSPTTDLLTDDIVERCKEYVDCGMIVTDIAGFTAWTSRTEPSEVIETLGEMFQFMDERMPKFGVEKVSTVGDCLIAAAFPRKAVNKEIRCLNTVLYAIAILPSAKGLKLRIGVHVGALTGGFVGSTPPKFEVFGEDVDEVKKLEEKGVPAKVHMSQQILREVQTTGEPVDAEPVAAMGGIAISNWKVDREGASMGESMGLGHSTSGHSFHSSHNNSVVEQKSEDKQPLLSEDKDPLSSDNPTTGNNNNKASSLDINDLHWKGFTPLQVFMISRALIDMGSAAKELPMSATEQSEQDPFMRMSTKPRLSIGGGEEMITVESVAYDGGVSQSFAPDRRASLGQSPPKKIPSFLLPSPSLSHQNSLDSRDLEASGTTLEKRLSSKGMEKKGSLLLMKRGSDNSFQRQQQQQVNTSSASQQSSNNTSPSKENTGGSSVHQMKHLQSSNLSGTGQMQLSATFASTNASNSGVLMRDDTEVLSIQSGGEGVVEAEVFHPIKLEFEKKIIEFKFKKFLKQSGLLQKTQFIQLLMLMYLAIAHMLLGCFDTMRNRLLFGYIIVVIGILVVMFRVGVEFKGANAVVCALYFSVAFTALFQTATCGPNQDESKFYTGLIISMYILMNFLVTQFLLNKRQKIRLLMNCGCVAFGYMCNLIRTFALDDDVLPFDIVWIVGFLGLAFVSYFADFSLRSAFVAERRLKQMLKVSKGRHQQATKAALDVMLPPFVASRLLGEEKRTKKEQNDSQPDADEEQHDFDGSTSMASAANLAMSGSFDEMEIDVTDTSSLSIAEKLWDFRGVCVMFIYFGFEAQGSQSHFIETIHQTFMNMERILREHNSIFKIKTIGTSMLCVNGIKDEVDCVNEMISAAIRIKNEVLAAKLNWKYTIGMHYGPAMGAVLGTQSLMFDIFGDTVNMASRMASNARPHSIQVTPAVNERCDNYETVARDPISVKGKGQVYPFEVTDKPKDLNGSAAGSPRFSVATPTLLGSVQ